MNANPSPPDLLGILSPDLAAQDLRARRMAALTKGNETYSRQAALKRRIHAGGVAVTAILNDTAILDAADARAAARMTIRNLLLAIPYQGKTRVRKLLAAAMIPESRRVEELTAQQRAGIVARLNAPLDSRYSHRPPVHAR